jgi:hypothetical protein
MAKIADGAAAAPPTRDARRQGPPDDTSRPIPLLAMNGALDTWPHDAGVRRAMELLCRGSPILRTGSACDLACTYCCVGPDGAPLEPVAVLRRQLDGLAALGHRGVGYMGGEPALHPGFREVVAHARTRGFTCQMLCTNGVRLGDAAFAEEVFAAGVTAVTTSLDAFDAAVQEPLYGGRAVHPQALAGLDHALAAPGVEVLVSAVVTAENAALLPGYMAEVDRRSQRHGKPIGVMLCVLQRPFRDGPEQRALALGLLDAAGLVAEALAAARAHGVAAFTFGFPPCLLRGHEGHVSELYATEWVVDLDTGATSPSRLRDASTYWGTCVNGPHAWYCPGVLNQYADAAVQAAVAAQERDASE